ncbi:DUF6436 domain-containing protein [Shewanella amazonensis]|uniref:DUF6436 domain-containing protein n=1 Tax=Shewanella amazonensis (strain ATCC BAA-1098 / SB2B) TaxID=326297 RepID=A1S894_SHEAM|nr:DUF6436 domain-containing protein [Shewanella amazonensis]ABM00601.1 conserved hypothetical protein [Shewanella amazonensis SB2B]
MTKKRLSVLILSVWLVSVLAAFWWLELRHISKMEPSLLNQHGVEREVADLIKAAGSGATDSGLPVVVHFIDPGCDCSDDTYAHLEQLTTASLSKVSAKLPEHTNLLYTPDNAGLPETLKHMKRITLNQVPEVTPVVGVWKSDGSLVYLGAYSTGPSCGSGADLLREALLNAAGESLPLLDWPIQVSCHCRWRT